MECKVVRQYLDAYFNQALGDEQTRLIDEHLFRCDHCFELLPRSQELLRDLDDPGLARLMLTQPPPLPKDFAARVMERVEDERPRGVNLIWPWLRKHWSRRQFVSVAYAMSATMVVVSAGNLLFLWTESTGRVSVWLAQGQAYWDTVQAYWVPVTEQVLGMWQALTTLLY